MDKLNTIDLSQSASQITVTNTATTLKSLLQTADNNIPDSMFKGENAIDFIEIQPDDGNIRLANGSAPTTDIGTVIYQSTIYALEGADPRDLQLIRDGGSNVKVNVLRLGRRV